jgi:cation diffusion facilitator family transporter
MNRDQVIIKTSVTGILANVFLSIFKAFVGTLTHSIAITMDALNNLSDAMSSIITIVGTKLSNKAPDAKHPLGYGRIEYLSAAIISLIVLYAGISAFVESVKNIINPSKPDYSTVSLIIVAVAVVVKIILGRYVKHQGEKVNSNSLIASGEDALNDSIISMTTLVAAFIYIFFHVSLEAYLGAIIAAVIIKAGLDMLKETLSEILGERVDSDLSKDIKKTINEFDDVHGAYDLILNSYGVDRYLGSVHIEVRDTMTAREIDELERAISTKIYEKYQVILAGISIYSLNTTNDHIADMYSKIRQCVMSHDHVLEMHGFYVNEEEHSIQFDIIIDFKEKDRQALFNHIHDDIAKMYPDYKLYMVMDADISD